MNFKGKFKTPPAEKDSLFVYKFSLKMIYFRTPCAARQKV